MDYDEIKQRLPHEAPYILLDRILTLEENTVIALKNVSGCECFTQFHYPSKAIYPGVLLVEMVSQAAALLISVDAEMSAKVPLLGGINHFYIQKPVVPGDQLIVKVNLEKRVRELVLISALITCNSETVARGQVSFGEKDVEDI